MSKETIVKLEEYIKNIDNKNVSIFFCVPDVEVPTSSVNEIYFQAKTLHDNGFKVVMLTENSDEQSKWVDSEYSELKHEKITKGNLVVSPSDILVIPEVFTNVMEQTKNIPALRVVLLQSIDYMLNGLVIGSDWSTFGIKNVISNNGIGVDIINYFYKRGFVVKNYDIGIPDYFKSDNTPKKPIISIVSRNSNDITKIIKLFYAKYPEFSWVMFDPLLTKTQPPQFLDRKEFANRLKENFAAIWIDRLSTFGTFPLECMKSGVIPVALIPEIEPDYFSKNSKELVDSGYWTNNIYNIPTIIAELVTNFLNDTIDDKVFETLENVSKDYSAENSKNQILGVFDELLNERKDFFEQTITELKNKENDTE